MYIRIYELNFLLFIYSKYLFIVILRSKLKLLKLPKKLKAHWTIFWYLIIKVIDLNLI